MIQPIKNNVLVKPFMNSDKTEGGILVPDSYLTESDKVEIIAVGTGTAKKKMTLKAGDIAYRVKNWGEPLIENGVTYYLMDAGAILAKA